MHVRIAWEILSHQKKENPDKTGTTPSSLANKSAEIHRPPTHLFPAGVIPRPHELSAAFPGGLPGRPPYEGPIPSSLFTGPSSHIGT